MAHFFKKKQWYMYSCSISTSYLSFTQTNVFGLFSSLHVFFKKNGPTLASFLFTFGLFNQTIQFLQQINVEKCPSSIWHRDLNP